VFSGDHYQAVSSRQKKSDIVKPKREHFQRQDAISDMLNHDDDDIKGKRKVRKYRIRNAVVESVKSKEVRRA
jgi:hypothetical protein